MGNSQSPYRAFSKAQLELLKQAPFHVTVWDGKVMGSWPGGVSRKVVNSCVDKGVLTPEQDGLRVVFHLTPFGKQVLTGLEAYDKLTSTKETGDTDGHEIPD